MPAHALPRSDGTRVPHVQTRHDCSFSTGLAGESPSFPGGTPVALPVPPMKTLAQILLLGLVLPLGGCAGNGGGGDDDDDDGGNGVENGFGLGACSVTAAGATTTGFPFALGVMALGLVAFARRRR